MPSDHSGWRSSFVVCGHRICSDSSSSPCACCCYCYCCCCCCCCVRFLFRVFVAASALELLFVTLSCFPPVVFRRLFHRCHHSIFLYRRPSRRHRTRLFGYTAASPVSGVRARSGAPCRCTWLFRAFFTVSCIIRAAAARCASPSSPCRELCRAVAEQHYGRIGHID